MAFTNMDAGTRTTILAIALFVRGIGLRVAGIPVMAAAYHGLTNAQIARATSGLHVVQRLGASFGTAFLAVVLHRWSALTPGVTDIGPGVVSAQGFNAAFHWATVFAIIALFPALILPRSTDSGTERMTSDARDHVPAAGPTPCTPGQGSVRPQTRAE